MNALVKSCFVVLLVAVAVHSVPLRSLREQKQQMANALKTPPTSLLSTASKLLAKGGVRNERKECRAKLISFLFNMQNEIAYAHLHPETQNGHLDQIGVLMLKVTQETSKTCVSVYTKLKVDVNCAPAIWPSGKYNFQEIIDKGIKAGQACVAMLSINLKNLISAYYKHSNYATLIDLYGWNDKTQEYSSEPKSLPADELKQIESQKAKALDLGCGPKASETGLYGGVCVASRAKKCSYGTLDSTNDGTARCIQIHQGAPNWICCVLPDD